MKRTLAVASIAGLAVVYACSDSTPPVTQEQADEALAFSISGAGVDPNADATSGAHTATPPAISCTYDATTKWTTCGPSTMNGLTVTRQMQFLDGTGNAQQRPDTSTRSMKSKTTVTGTMTMKTATATGTTTVNRTSEETVTGFGPLNTPRVVNGTATGTEDSQGTDTRGTVAVKRAYSDTTKALTLPSVFNAASPWPISGTIIRNVKASVTLDGAAAKDYVSHEVQTFAAGGKLTIVVTMNGQTRTCVFQLVAPPAIPTKPVCTQG